VAGSGSRSGVSAVIPCRIKGAGQEHSAERPVIPVVVLVELIDNVPARYRALLLLATFANLRFGELAGLRQNQVDLDLCEVRVDRSTAELDDGRLIEGGPKSHAGIRTVAFPTDIVRSCVTTWSASPIPIRGAWSSSGRREVGCAGRTSASSGTRARGAVGLPELHFHDLRHTGNTMAAAQGATLRELMERMGHSSPRAALIYLHATRERDERIASGMGKLLKDARRARKTGTTAKGSDATGTRQWSCVVRAREHQRIMCLTGVGTVGAGDGNRTRMTSLEGVLHRAVRSTELGSSSLCDVRGCPVRTGSHRPANGPTRGAGFPPG
jgi:hypothetical protein